MDGRFALAGRTIAVLLHHGNVNIRRNAFQLLRLQAYYFIWFIFRCIDLNQRIDEMSSLRELKPIS